MFDWMQQILLAPFVGSFLGVLVRRLPAGRPIALARSACESCGRVLGPAELVPLLSFALQRGRCRGCGARISTMHPAIELAALAVAASVVAVADPDLTWVGCGLGWTLLALAWVDADAMLLPDALTLPLIVVGLLEAWALEPWSLTDRAIGAIAGYGAFRLVEIGYRRLRGVDGLGQGDAKLLAAAGAWLGWQQLPWVVVGGATLGMALAGGLALAGRAVGRRTEMPFGPPLAAAIWVLWLLLNRDAP